MQCPAVHACACVCQSRGKGSGRACTAGAHMCVIRVACVQERATNTWVRYVYLASTRVLVVHKRKCLFQVCVVRVCTYQCCICANPCVVLLVSLASQVTFCANTDQEVTERVHNAAHSRSRSQMWCSISRT